MQEPTDDLKEKSICAKLVESGILCAVVVFCNCDESFSGNGRILDPLKGRWWKRRLVSRTLCLNTSSKQRSEHSMFVLYGIFS